MTRLYCVSGVPGLALAAAAELEPGVLVVANEADAAEAVPDWWRTPGVAALTGRFDAIVSWNELIAPLHPGAWLPPAAELPMLTRLLRERLGVGGPPTELVVESLDGGPGAALAALVPDVPVTLLASSALVYGPTPGNPATELIERVTRLVYVDLVTGLRPLLLPDRPPPPTAVSRADYRAALALLPTPEPTSAVLLDEGWAARGVLTDEQEHRLLHDALTSLAATGHRSVTLAPDAAAAPVDRTALIGAASDIGVALQPGPPGIGHEAWLAAEPDVVAGTAATALHLAPSARTIGTRLVLERLRPYEHPARIPLTIADAALPRLDRTPPPGIDQRLIDSVAYCMRSNQLPDLRNTAQNWLDGHDTRPYFDRDRLEALHLVPLSARARVRARVDANPALRSVVRRLSGR